MIKDSLLLYKDYGLSSLSCPSCGKSSHLISNCPYVTYNPDRDFIIKREIHSQLRIKRLAFARRNKKSLNSLIIKRDLGELIEINMKAEKNKKKTIFFGMSPEKISPLKQYGISENSKQSTDFGGKRKALLITSNKKKGGEKSFKNCENLEEKNEVFFKIIFFQLKI